MEDALEILFVEARRLLDRGHLEAARDILLELNQKDPKSVRILTALGSAYYELGAWEEAAGIFKRATAISATLEGLSKGLFHSLWNLGRYVEALEEARRFLSVSDSEDYRQMIREVNEKW